MPDKQRSSSEQSIPPVKKARIYTMPDKFYIDDKNKRGGKNGLIIVMMSVAALLVIGAGVYFFVIQPRMDQDTKNENTAVVTPTTNTNINTAVLNNSNLNGNTNNLVLLNTNQVINTATNVSTNLNLFTTNTNAAPNVNVVPSSQDSDADGLTNVEEALYGSSLSVADTDGDSFADGQEVLGGYNPNGTGKLEGNSAIRIYTNTVDGYTIFYPTSWVISDDPQNTRGKIFATTGEFISVSVQDNPALLSARDWYLTKSPGIDSAAVQTISNWDATLSGVLSIDKTTAYFTKGSLVYVLSYNTNILTEANYKTTFNMMYLSIALAATTTNTNSIVNVNVNTNTNTNSNSNTNTNSNTNLGL